MISPAMRSLLWKEYRQQRGFWLAMFLFSVTLQMLPLLAVAFNGQSPDAFWVFAVALGIPALYALGCGATAFAGEHDAETYAFQRALPVSPGQLVWGKLSFALGSSLVLPPLLWPVAWAVVQGELPTRGNHLLLWSGSYVALLELLAWGLFWSLLCPRPMWAVVLAAISAVITGFAAVPYLWWTVIRHPVLHEAEYAGALPWRLLVAVLLLGLDAALGQRWLGVYPWLPRAAAARGSYSGAAKRRGGGTGSLPAFGRLLWHEWRQSRGTLAAACGCFLLLFLWIRVMEANHGQPSSGREWLVPGLVLAPWLATVLGALAFSGDQRKHQFRYFAEHGIGARAVWLSRQLIWLTPICLWWLVLGPWAAGRDLDLPVLPSQALPEGGLLPSDMPWLTVRLGLLGLSVLGFAAGQLCSLFLRSSILAFFSGLIFGVLVGLWAGLMTWLRVPLWFSVVPIPMILGWSTWLRAPDWVAEKTTRGARVRAGAALLVPALVVLVAVAAFRAYEIPRVPLQDLVAEPPPATAEEIATAELYREAARLLNAATDQAQRDKGLAKFLEASRRASCRFPDAAGLGGFEGSVAQALRGTAVHNALAQAAELDAAEETSQALDLYFAVLRLARQCRQATQLSVLLMWGDAFERLADAHLWEWSARARRTPQELRDVIRRLESEPPASLPHLEAAWRAELTFQSDTVAFRNSVLRDAMGERSATTLRVLRWMMPWEAARTQRLLDLGARDGLAGLRRIEPPLNRGWPYEGFPSLYGDATIARWRATTPLAKFVDGPGQVRHLADQQFRTETRRRVLPVQLALAAYRLEHGRLPKRLDELVGDYLREVPLDPYVNTQIVYQPQGCQEPLFRAEFPSQGRIGDIASMVPSQYILAPGTPFLWVTGPYVITRAALRDVRGQAIDPPGCEQYWRRSDDTLVQLESQTDLWRTGWVLALTPATPAQDPTP